MGKKKPFIDKKKASKYHILHRSQRDVAKGDFVLWPSPDNNPEIDQKVLANDFQELRSQLQDAGLLDAEDHEKYLKPMSGDGMFLDAKTGKATKLHVSEVVNNHNHTTNSELAEDNLMEVQRQFDSIPLTADCMDEDIAAALFGDFDEQEFEELDDAFVLQASEVTATNDTDNNNAAFDFDAHIQQLIEKAKRARGSLNNESDEADHGQADQEFFGGLRPLQEEDDEEAKYLQALDPDEEKALCDLFHETLAEYDDDDESADAPEIHGPMVLEGNAMLDAALDEFLLEDPQDILIQKEITEQRPKGGFSILVGKQMVPAKELEEATEHPEQEPARPLEELWKEAEDTLAQPKQQPPAEEIFIDGKSYFSERERNQWDCESILSTYSNLDNNPRTVDVNEGRRRRRRKLPDEKIRLSKKTGLPIEKVVESKPYDDDLTATVASVNRGVPRPKAETAEERRLRKQMVKKERELSRIQKKMTKEAFDDEFRRRAVPIHDDVAGTTVFRFA